MLPAGLRRGRPHLPRVPERATIYLPLLPEGQGSGVLSPAPCQDPEAAGLLCACNCWADHSDDTTGGKSLPARSVFLTVILCPGTNEGQGASNPARTLFVCEQSLSRQPMFSSPERKEENSCGFVHSYTPHQNQAGMFQKRRSHFTRAAVKRPRAHVPRGVRMQPPPPPPTRDEAAHAGLDLYWLRMAHSWGPSPPPFQDHPL